MALTHLFSRSVLGIPLSLMITLFAILAVAIYRYLISLRIPHINRHRNDWFGIKAKATFVARCSELLVEGRKRFGESPFMLTAMFGERLVLPEEWLGWVASHPDLDHQAHVAEEFFGYLPGFEAIAAINDPHAFVISLIKSRMSSMTPSMLKSFREQADDVLAEEFGDDESFHPINWTSACIKLVSHMSASIFVGPELASNAKWQEITLTYTRNMFSACVVLRSWPAPLRRFAVWFIPEGKVCRDQIAEARALVANYLRGNREKLKGTAFEWMDPRADPTTTQLALAMASIHTTSQLLNQALLDIAFAAQDQNHIVSQLREELQGCLESSHGEIGPATLPKLGLLEACIKETQRLKPQTAVNLERMALRSVVLPNGMRIAAGSMVCVNATKMWRQDIWGDDSESWNPSRWAARDSESLATGTKTNTPLLPAGDKLVNSSARHFAFGKGRAICPGRFMVNAELKIALGAILDGWDCRLSESDFATAKATGRNRVDWVPYGFETLVNENVVVEVRRRK